MASLAARLNDAGCLKGRYMQVKSIVLHNIGQFEELVVPLAPLTENAPKVTVFIGNNGSGKTTVLKSLVTALSWLPARIRSERGRGLEIPEDVISNGQPSGMVMLNVIENGQTFQWQLSKAKLGKKNQFNTDLKAVSALADNYRTALTENQAVNLPLLVFYPVERSVLDIPLRIKGKHKFEHFEAYDNALEMGVDFRRFFEWFRNREDIENEENSSHRTKEMGEDVSRYNEVASRSLDILDEIYEDNIKLNKISKAPRKNSAEIKSIKEKIEGNIRLVSSIKQEIRSLERQEYIKKDTQLEAVRNTIQEFTDFSKIKVQRKPNLRLVVQKHGNKFVVQQLSQGEKSLMALVGDIARRLAMLNPNLENPLEGCGIVMIDEADLHLHPQWQRQLIARLTKTFPNCQFVLSTHSPLVISDSKDIVVYSLENGEMVQIPSQYGQDANTVLLEAMDTAYRNELITNELSSLIDLIQDNRIDEAKKKLQDLQRELPQNHLELSKAQLLLRKQEIRHAKNQ